LTHRSFTVASGDCERISNAGALGIASKKNPGREGPGVEVV